MTKVALLLSAGVFVLAGAAVAQNAGVPRTPAAGAPTAAGTAASQSPVPQGGPQVQTSSPAPTASRQASDAACNADAQKFCSGKEASELVQCLNENKASLATACRAIIDGPPRN
jgi:hypothetical protein